MINTVLLLLMRVRTPPCFITSQARLVLILRDPTARTLSNFNHNWHIRTLRQRNMQLTGDAEVTHYVELFNHTLMAEVNVLSTCFDRFGGSNDDEAATAVWRCLQLDQLEVGVQ